MKKTDTFLSIISFILITTILVIPVLAQTEPTDYTEPVTIEQTVGGCFSTDATDAFIGNSQLIKNAKSVFLYELNTQTLMYAWQPDLKLSPSSFVKIVTAIIAIENGQLDSAITVTDSALADLPASAVSVKLQVSEVLTLEDLLYCMLVGSGNDAAAVIAQHIGGSQLKFVEKMNAFADKIGCTGSHFTNAHGIHDPQQVTTARDTAKILAYAMENETFRKIFSATEYTVPATNKSANRYLVTGNYMMTKYEVEIYFDERIVGGRTGVANDSTRCLASIARDGSMELLCVVMGAASVYEEGGNRIRSFGGYNETKDLLDLGFNGYSASQILYNGQALLQFELPNADTLLTVGPHSAVSTILPDNATLDDITFRYSKSGSELRAPISTGEKVCTVEVWYNDLRLAETELFAMNDVRDQSIIRLYERKETSVWVIVLTILAVVVLLVVLYLYLRSRRGRRIVFRLRKKIAKFRRRKRHA